MTITQKQFDDHIQTHWNEHFFKALVEHIRISMKLNEKDNQEEYRNELKQLIWEAVSDGVKNFLDESYEDFSEKLGNEIASSLEFSFSIERKKNKRK
jgi:hypothetical protein